MATYEQSELEDNIGSQLYIPKNRSGKYIDLYALGVILVEMLLFFNTGSERIVCLKNLKEGIIDTRLEMFPKYYDIVKYILDGGNELDQLL